MLDKFLPYEKSLFLFVNGTHTYFWDNTMWLFSDLKIWMPMTLVLIINIIYKMSWTKWLPILLAIIVVFTLCDQFSSHLMKPLFERPRPTHYPGIMENVRTLNGYTGGKYGFISGHATNSFGFAMFTLLLFRNRYYSIVILLWAVLISYSRVYLGVHFISDIIAGAISGSILGALVYKLYQLGRKKIIQYYETDTVTVFYPTAQINLLTITISVYMLLMVFSSELIVSYFI
ncbi:phosphatase PAP2 family protein [Dysgonomonas sp. 216]|uniref:phosphatase PAP2 family protein n=1 Tax=Dysgonomonas sp. 216 TaxID=2302934 RepID=UPI0013D46029|nr:phosphatase PAP2 family protein [Dysgonomonas sp. 216]